MVVENISSFIIYVILSFPYLCFYFCGLESYIVQIFFFFNFDIRIELDKISLICLFICFFNFQRLQISFFCIGTLTMLITAANAMPFFIVIALFMGLFDGCFISLLGPIAFDIVGTAGASQAIGCLLAFCSIPLTCGPAIAGERNFDLHHGASACT